MTIFLKLLISSILFTLSSSQQDLSFTYTGFHHTNITLNDVALIEKHGVIRLTNESSKVQGHAFYPSPITFKNSTNSSVSSFSTCFAFCIHPEYPKLGGHGLAFTISPSTELNSPLPSQYLGLLNSHDAGNFSNHLFAVEFDTVQDFEFGDVDGNHVGIDINSLDSNSSASAAYFTDDSKSNVSLNLKSGRPILAWIEYDSVTKLINVTISPSSDKPKRPLLSYKIDLSPILLDSMYIGFSASTGVLASSHYVSGWSFRMNGEAKSLDLDSLPLIPGTKRIIHKTLIVSLSVFAFFVLLALIFAGICVVRRIKYSETIEDWEIEVGPQRYKYLELKQATQNFKDSELLGFGGFGKVYKGTMPHTKLNFAVKRISHESKQGVREFVSEISTIGRLRHRNLVQLLGWCRRGVDLLLVYEFMPNGSLDRFLFDEPKCVLSWDQRFRIIKGVASGLLYLHEGYEQVVIHRDVKASNVLLDGEMNGKLGDFGLAKLYDHGSNPSTTRVVGTFGYLAPEMPRTGRATTWSDVFAFGTLLLEVACGRRPIEHKTGPDDLVLLDYVWAKSRAGRLLDVVDERLKDDFDENEVSMVLKLGLMCSSYQQLARPSMRQVVSYLEGEVELPAVLRPSCPNEGGFENYMHPYESASFERTSSSFTDMGNGNVDRSFPSCFTSPNSILHSLGEPR